MYVIIKIIKKQQQLNEKNIVHKNPKAFILRN